MVGGGGGGGGGEDDKKVFVRSRIVERTKTVDRNLFPPNDHFLLPAHPSQDMWSLGCILFSLCTKGETLWPADDEDNIDDKHLKLLKNWGENKDLRREKLDKIYDLSARNLVSILLNASAQQRPKTIQHVLDHPFFSLKSSTRLDATFDVFLSYRVKSELKMVEMLYDVLTARGVKVWLDKRCLKPGKEWDKGFVIGLAQSRTFVPLLSRQGIKAQFESHHRDTAWCDNVLLEHLLALELREREACSRKFSLF